MKANEILREQVLKIVDNQLKGNDPPEAKQTFERLTGLGYDADDARIYIAQCVAIETYHILKDGEPFNKERYIKNLNKLPEEPFED